MRESYTRRWLPTQLWKRSHGADLGRELSNPKRKAATLKQTWGGTGAVSRKIPSDFRPSFHTSLYSIILISYLHHDSPFLSPFNFTSWFLHRLTLFCSLLISLLLWLFLYNHYVFVYKLGGINTMFSSKTLLHSKVFKLSHCLHHYIFPFIYLVGFWQAGTFTPTICNCPSGTLFVRRLHCSSVAIDHTREASLTHHSFLPSLVLHLFTSPFPSTLITHLQLPFDASPNKRRSLRWLVFTLKHVMIPIGWFRGLPGYHGSSRAEQ